jgi:two-component system phosphate regulon sensor histidine kinase PhoR
LVKKGKSKQQSIKITLALLTGIIILLSLFFILKHQIEIFHQFQITDHAEIIANELDAFLQIGQINISGYAQDSLISQSNDQQYESLKRDFIPIPFFTQLSLYDPNGKFLAGFPQNSGKKLEEVISLDNEIRDPQRQTIILKDSTDNLTDSNLFFISQIRNQANVLDGFLIGKADFINNPLNFAFFSTLTRISQSYENIFIINRENNILYMVNNKNSNYSPINLLKIVNGYLVSVQPLRINDWQTLVTFPQNLIYQEIITSIIPFIILFAITVSFLWLILKINTKSTAEKQASIIQQNSSFFNLIEKIKNSPRNVLINRIEEKPIKKIVVDNLSQFIIEISEQRDIDNICDLFLKHINFDPTSAIRCLIFHSPYSEKLFDITAHGRGNKSDQYSYLDDQIIRLIKEGVSVIIPDIKRIHQLRIPPDKEYPHSIYAFPIKYKGIIYGVLWLSFNEPFNMSEVEIKALTDLVDSGSAYIANLVNLRVFQDIAHHQEVVLQSIDSPIIILNEKDQVIYSNNAAQRINPDFNINVGEHIEKFINEQKLLNVFKTKETSEKDLEYENVSNKTYLVQRFDKELNNNKKIKVIVFTDKTQEKQSKESLSENISLLSHNLRSPLTIIKGYTTMLPIMGQLNDQQKEYIEKILYGVDEMTRLVKNLMNNERLEMGAEIHKEKVIINELIDKAINSLMPIALQKKIEVKKEFENQIVEISVDPVLIELALYNLIDNAIHFSPIQGLIKICLMQSTNNVEIDVEDMGMGIAPIDIPHIFDKFYKVKISPGNEQTNSGIGLELVKMIIEKHNGEVGVKSSLGKGSTFYIRLPR